VIHRTISLPDNRAAVTVHMEVHNPNDGPREVQMRSNLSLDLGDIEGIHVGFTSRSGQKVVTDMREVIAGYREGLHYYKSECPAGDWTFTGSAANCLDPDKSRAPRGPLHVIQRFDKRAIDFTRLVAYPDDLNELEVALWAKKQTVPPGGSALFEHEIELRAE